MSWYDAKFGEITVRRWRGTAIKPYRHLLLSRRSAMGQSETIEPNTRRGRVTLSSGLDGSATVRQHQCTAPLRSFDLSEVARKRWRDGSVGVQGADDAQISVWVFTIYGGRRLCADPRGTA